MREGLSLLCILPVVACCSWNLGLAGVDGVGWEACNRVGNLVTFWVVVPPALKGLGVICGEIRCLSLSLPTTAN